MTRIEKPRKADMVSVYLKPDDNDNSGLAKSFIANTLDIGVFS